MGIAGNGASYKILQEAGIDDADLIIAVTGSDELNLLCCTITTQVGNCAAIARVRTPEYSQRPNICATSLVLHSLSIPELEAAIEMAHILHLPSSLEVTNFAHGQAQLIKYEIPEGSILDGTKLMDLGTRHHANILIGAVERDDEVTIPSGDFVLPQGRQAVICRRTQTYKGIFQPHRSQYTQRKNTLIIGRQSRILPGKAAHLTWHKGQNNRK